MLWLIATLPLACDLPRDPHRTLERARSGSLRVALSEHRPWVVKAGDEARGVEVELVRAFADTIGARIEWSWGMIDAQLAALERYELDLAIGGLTDSSPWRAKLGFTKPYFHERIVVAVSASSTPPGDLTGLEIGCEPGTLAAHHVRKAGGRPVPLAEAQSDGRAIAAPEWQVRAWGMKPTDHELHEDAHVVAVAPGENALLVALERFLLRQRDIAQRLEREAAA